MSVRLRDNSFSIPTHLLPPKKRWKRIEYFNPIPKEIIIEILSRVPPEIRFNTSSFSKIACVCKVWNECLHDVTVNLLNANEICLSDVPFIFKMSHDWDRNITHTYKYLKFLQGEVSQEDLERLLGSQVSTKNETLKIRKLTYFDLSSISEINVLKRKKLKCLFSGVEFLYQPRCSFNDNSNLGMFENVKTLVIGPNEYTDLSFIPKLSQLEFLSLTFTSLNIIKNALATLSKCASISTLHLNAPTNFFPFEFPDSFRLPPELNELSLKNFVFSRSLFGTSSKIERLHLTFTPFANPVIFEGLNNLDLVSIECSLFTEHLTLKHLKVKHLDIQAAFLKDLWLDHVTWQTMVCPEVKIINISPILIS